MSAADIHRRSASPLVIGFVLLALLIGLLAYWAWRQQAQSIQRQAERSLAAVGALKSNQISSWLGERRSDAELISGNPLISAAVADLLAGRQGAHARSDLSAVLTSYRRAYAYPQLVLASPRRGLLLSSPGAARLPRRSHHGARAESGRDRQGAVVRPLPGRRGTRPPRPRGSDRRPARRPADRRDRAQRRPGPLPLPAHPVLAAAQLERRDAARRATRRSGALPQRPALSQALGSDVQRAGERRRAPRGDGGARAPRRGPGRRLPRGAGAGRRAAGAGNVLVHRLQGRCRRRARSGAHARLDDRRVRPPPRRARRRGRHVPLARPRGSGGRRGPRAQRRARAARACAHRAARRREQGAGGVLLLGLARPARAAAAHQRVLGAARDATHADSLDQKGRHYLERHHRARPARWAT